MTRVRQLIRFMTELESGFDRTQIPLPKTTLFLKTEQPLSGRLRPFVPNNDNDEDYSDLASIPWIWQPTEEPTPSRWYPARTKAHVRGTITSPVTQRAITYSSTYEMDLAYMLLANRRILKVQDQPQPIMLERDDRERSHTIDYLASLDNGYRVHVAVRPTWLIEKDDLADTIARINAGALDGVADEAIILTEREITTNRGWNGKSILHALRGKNTSDNDRLREYVGSFHGKVAIRDFQRISRARPPFGTPSTAWFTRACSHPSGRTSNSSTPPS